MKHKPEKEPANTKERRMRQDRYSLFLHFPPKIAQQHSLEEGKESWLIPNSIPKVMSRKVNGQEIVFLRLTKKRFLPRRKRIGGNREIGKEVQTSRLISEGREQTSFDHQLLIFYRTSIVQTSF